MNARQIFDGSSADATRALYAKLDAIGPIGRVASSLFRAQKCSERAKAYRRGAWKREAYERKNWSIGLLCDCLALNAESLGIVWGWREDPNQEFHNQVVYVELETGQCSFHSETRGKGHDFEREWAQGSSRETILLFVESLLTVAVDG